MSVGAAITTIPPRREMLAAALSSVISQTRPADQIAVSVDTRRRGVTATRNEAWQSLSTEYVAFLDDDDIWYPDHIADLLAVAENTDADLVYPWFDIDYSQRPGWAGVTEGSQFMFVNGVSAEGHPFDEVAADELARRSNFIPITVLVRRSALEAVGGFPTPGSEAWPHEANEDWGCWRAMLADGAKFVHHPARTWLWRWHTTHTMGRPRW